MVQIEAENPYILAFLTCVVFSIKEELLWGSEDFVLRNQELYILI